MKIYSSYSAVYLSLKLNVLMILRLKVSVLSLFFNLENWEIHIEFIKSNIKTLKLVHTAIFFGDKNKIFKLVAVIPSHVKISVAWVEK